MCQCNSLNCGCTPDEYTSGLTYDGLKFSCSPLNTLKPDCVKLNKVLETFGTAICQLTSRVSKIQIGAWDMDTNASITIPHGLTTAQYNEISGVSALIHNDGDTLKSPIGMFGIAKANGNVTIDATNVIITRVASETFDAVAYSLGVANRGYILITF